MVQSMFAAGGITEAALSPSNQRCTEWQIQPVPSNTPVSYGHKQTGRLQRLWIAGSNM